MTGAYFKLPKTDYEKLKKVVETGRKVDNAIQQTKQYSETELRNLHKELNPHSSETQYALHRMNDYGGKRQLRKLRKLRKSKKSKKSKKI